MKKDKRPDWDTYFMQLADVVKTRSNCIRRDVGAILVKDLRIIATGYNGTPHGIKNCIDGGCVRCAMREAGKLRIGEKEELCVCIHAEQNAIIQAAIHGISTKDSVLYSTVAPCNQCAKILINAGISRIVFRPDPHYPDGVKLMKKAGVALSTS